MPRTVSGDAFWYAERGPVLWALVVDGLGSGEAAAEAAQIAVACIAREAESISSPFDPRQVLTEMLSLADGQMRRSRGAALGLAMLDAEAREGYFAGVGNVEMRVLGNGTQVRPVGVPGIVGAGLPRMRVEAFPYHRGHLVVLHSDGLSPVFEVEPHECAARPLEALAERLVSAHAKNDDLTLLLVRQHA